MITVTSKKKTVKIHNKWPELNQDEFVDTVSIIARFQHGNLDFASFRLSLLKALSGYSRKKRVWKLTPEKQEMIDFNLMRLSELMTFAVKPHYEDETVLDFLSDHMQQKLQEVFPSEIYDPEEWEEIEPVIHHLKPVAEINYNIGINHMQELYHNNRFYKGISWKVDKNGVATTNMTAGMFVDMQQYYDFFIRFKNEEYLDFLISVFYSDPKTYQDIEAQERAKLFSDLQPEQKAAILFVYQAMMQYLRSQHPYHILFGKAEEPEEVKINAGANEAIYTLAKDYGNINDMFRMPVADYLNLLVKQITDAVKMMRGMDKKPAEIAKELKLEPSIIAQI